MDATKKALLGRFLKTTRLVIESIEDDSGENSKIAKITLAEPVSTAGSQFTDTGAVVRIDNAVVAFVAGDVANPEPGSDLEALLNGCTETADGKLVYEGPLKMDVNKPRVSFRNGAAQVTNPSKLWITSVAFNRRGAGLRAQSQAALSDVMKQLFGQGSLAPNAPAKTALNVVAEQEAGN